MKIGKERLMTRLVVTKLPLLNTLVLRELDGKDYFIAASNSIIITPQSLATILKFLVINNFLDIKVLEGVIQECREVTE
jgi:hypothetical protein